jgi:lysophospholipase L1-like esterase
VKQSANKITNVKQKIIIIGDSHARNSAAKLQHNLDSTFTVSSFVKPGTGMGIIVDTVKEDIKELKNDDVVIVWGGSNDIGKNNCKDTLKHLCNFIKNNQMVNIVVMTAPPRHDLLPSSCVNSEVISFNKQLRKRMIPYNNVKILETNLERKYFTTHGLHLNSSGKNIYSS